MEIPVQKNSNVKLLVVDEHREYCALLKEQLEQITHGVQISCQFVHSGQDAIDAISEWEPSVVLLDAHLEDVSSFLVLDACRFSKATVVVSSDASGSEVEEKARAHGASGFFRKSYHPETLGALLNELAKVSLPVQLLH